MIYQVEIREHMCLKIIKEILVKLSENKCLLEWMNLNIEHTCLFSFQPFLSVGVVRLFAVEVLFMNRFIILFLISDVASKR